MTILLRKVSRGAWWALFVLSSALVAAYAFAFFSIPFRGSPIEQQFAVSGPDVPLHFYLAGLALLVAPLQLMGGLRRRWPRLHRCIGWLYAGSVLVGSVSGFSLALNAQGGLPARSAFVILALLWPTFTALGIRHAIARDFVRHRRWMLRSVALTYAAVTLRVVLFGGMALGLPFVPVYIAAAWLGWTINLAAIEWWLRRAGRDARLPLASGGLAPG